MKRIAKFEKVSLEQFTKDFDINTGLFPEEIYDGIKLPKRATKGSAGYDFYAPFDIMLKQGERIKIA